MEATIHKWGNSNAVRIPKAALTASYVPVYPSNLSAHVETLYALFALFSTDASTQRECKAAFQKGHKPLTQLARIAVSIFPIDIKVIWI